MKYLLLFFFILIFVCSRVLYILFGVYSADDELESSHIFKAAVFSDVCCIVIGLIDISIFLLEMTGGV